MQWRVVVMGPHREIADGYVDDILAGTAGDPRKDVESLLLRHDAEIRKVLDLLQEQKMGCKQK